MPRTDSLKCYDPYAPIMAKNTINILFVMVPLKKVRKQKFGGRSLWKFRWPENNVRWPASSKDFQIKGAGECTYMGSVQLNGGIGILELWS